MIYEQRLDDAQRVFVRGNSLVTAVEADEDAVRLEIREVHTGQSMRDEVDVVVLATGFRRPGARPAPGAVPPLLKAALAGTDPALEDQVWAGELPRSEPRMTTCIKYAYRYGILMRNNAGEVAHSPYFRSYLTAAKPGAVLRKPPEGWYQFAGSLAIAGAYRGPADIDRIERVAEDLDRRLDIVVV
ncbi:L-lysine 6-monooxygenase (NADPH-requiring) [Streptoalloteichus tenebrarius]|uniref:L-lysine N6-monooxygenase MbtG n=1 Tax=Streptoalloteichus tenebrarius (strain ATCC 17920 / DSM 40477 / JCM 4838 / CBS 697.72 / NBRC 16177 / NCIMB 11028 / NRRL B-12390 / A12253. 1 / ISP 5477) TaxID=1933 RepID=A0ABT1HLG8_STRSD|nr:SidA/IucD/PvdA family monooxygenase [Streptoalloteichus tenebrarius]MCP2256351.1 L-lysine 6-monooxygenase (NADPH-requiring) [Streptoalloteichus tenebrarius]BFF04691.1 hypothetical protein GCM10020241_63660 [Streptoalloteichus tenebrarius]